MGQKGQPDKVSIATLTGRIYQLENRRFVLWLPVCLGLGIWVYFALDSEPDPRWTALGLLPLAALASGLASRLGWGALVIAWALLAVAVGFGAALWSAHRADAPAVPYPLGETVEGRVIEISRSASGAPRLLLDRVMVYGIEPADTPARLRLTVLDPPPGPLPFPGTRIRVYASLMPTGRPVEPGAFDFHRRAFFQRLGGVGLTRGHLLEVPQPVLGPADRARIWLARVRDRLSRYLRETLPGRQGAFAAAIIVGDRIDIGDEDAEALRASNLAHLLAISGLHMGMLTGLVFALSRLTLALVPWTAYALSTKKAAAIAALLAGLAYLGLSGATVATQRAFVMVAVALLAVLFDRPALTLRALAVAALIILLVRPISLLDAGFQMSFAATAALVAGYEEMRARRLPDAPASFGWAGIAGRVVLVYLGGLVISSLLAGFSTAPIAAYHFNRTAPYGLLANLLALPVMGFWIAPMACLAAVLAPFGLADWALQVMGAGIEQVLITAHWVGGLPGAVQPVQAAPGIVLGLIALGGLWLMLWRGPWRFAGITAAVAGLYLWSDAPKRPDVLVSEGARLIGVMTPDGRTLDHDTAQSFAAKSWLRRDGDAANQAEAAMREGLTKTRGTLVADLAHNWRLEVRWGKTSEVDLIGACRSNTLLIARKGPAISGPCTYVGARDLARGGALSVHMLPTGPMIKHVRDGHRSRLWSR